LYYFLEARRERGRKRERDREGQVRDVLLFTAHALSLS